MVEIETTHNTTNHTKNVVWFLLMKIDSHALSNMHAKARD